VPTLDLFLHDTFVGVIEPDRRDRGRVVLTVDSGYEGGILLSEAFATLPGRRPSTEALSNFLGGYVPEGSHREKMAAVGALAAGVAHEIGNPIAAMSGVLQEMVDEQGEGKFKEEGRNKLTVLQTQIQRLSAITREISGFAAPQPMERQLLDLNGLVRTTAGLMGYDKRMNRVSLRLNLDSQLPAIYGVADQLTQVIMNLLINAADALGSRPEGAREINLRSELSGNNVCFTVADNGGGMDQATLNRAFEAFYTTKSKGTGLGLSLCYSIITGHGGTIEIESTPDQGTQVRIFLPLPADNEGDAI